MPDLLDRLDALRAFLLAAREDHARSDNAGEVEELDEHLATVDDACDALHTGPGSR